MLHRLLLLALPAVALTQTPADSSARLAPVVITATRAATPVRALASVRVLNGDSLRARGITHLADALRLEPGANVSTSSSFGSQASLFMRGGQSSYVRVLLDGVPLNEPGGALDLGALTLDNIDRVELVRGPTSVLYGADAVTGVIQLVSRTAASGGRSGAMTVDAGSYGQRGVALSSAVASARVTLTASLADRAAEGTLPFNNQYRNQTSAMNLRLTPDARTELTLSARLQAASYHYPTESDGTIADHNAENTTRRIVLALAGRRTLGKRVVTSWTLTSGEHRPRSNDGPDTRGDTLGYYGFFSRGVVTRRTANVQLDAHAGRTQLFTVGAEATRDHERSSSLSLSEFGDERGTFVAARNERALYVQAVGTAWQRGSYQLGARLDDNSAFGTFRTVRLAAAWQLARDWRVRAATGSAFRAPSFFENFATGYVRGNARLLPEQSRSRELGLEALIKGATLSVTAFQQRFRDLIQYTAITATPSAPNYLNVAGANADGIEADAAAPLGMGLRGRMTYSYTRTRVTDAGFDTGDGATCVLGQPLLRRPTHAGRIELVRAIGARGTLTLGAAYTGHMADRNYAAYPAVPVVLPSTVLADAAANLRLSAVDARVPRHLRLRVDNATNVGYQQVFGFRAPGRVLSVGLTVGRP